MNAVAVIEAKKRGEELSADAIRDFIGRYVAQEIPDYQMAAFLMAVWFRGMSDEETAELTGAMLRSGEELAWDGLGTSTADKHSTGGVGDKVSLLLAPLAAACGVAVPMLSGRGLGHTGGTLDKLEAVPGYDIAFDEDRFRRVVADVGCAVVGQGPRIAPADGRIYALRDVTGTVDCVPLITASIMSKKLAAGPRTVVIDLKVGDGAFMRDLESARELARRLVSVGRAYGRRMSVIFSDMSQPLGVAVGHANEAVESFAALRPETLDTAPRDLVTLTEELTADMVLGAGLAPDGAAALATVREAWRSGAAFAKLQEWLEAQGGRLDASREDFGLEVSPRAAPVPAPRDGVVRSVACRRLGLALGEIGGARRQVTDRLDLKTGLDVVVNRGDAVEAGQPLAWVRADDGDAAEALAPKVAACFEVGDAAAPETPLILDRIGFQDPG